jgi:hypothetical protein
MSSGLECGLCRSASSWLVCPRICASRQVPFPVPLVINQRPCRLPSGRIYYRSLNCPRTRTTREFDIGWFTKSAIRNLQCAIGKASPGAPSAVRRVSLVPIQTGIRPRFENSHNGRTRRGEGKISPPALGQAPQSNEPNCLSRSSMKEQACGRPNDPKRAKKEISYLRARESGAGPADSRRTNSGSSRISRPTGFRAESGTRRSNTK